MFYQIFLSPQVKRWAIITSKHGLYKFPHELPKELNFSRCALFYIKTRVTLKYFVSHCRQNSPYISLSPMPNWGAQ